MKFIGYIHIYIFIAWKWRESQNGIFNCWENDDQQWDFGVPEIKQTHLWNPAVSLADLFSELDPPLNDLNLWKFRLQQPGLTHELAAAGRWLGLFIGDHEGTQPVLFHPWLNFTNLTSASKEDIAGQCRTHGQHNADPKTWHHGQHTKSTSETTSQTLLAHQIPARNSVASRMENVCGSSVEMIANDAETYRNHELENRKFFALHLEPKIVVLWRYSARTWIS